MEDKIIIKSDRYNVKNVFKYALVIGIIIYASYMIFFKLPYLSRVIEYLQNEYNEATENMKEYEANGIFRPLGEYYSYGSKDYAHDKGYYGKYNSATAFAFSTPIVKGSLEVSFYSLVIGIGGIELLAVIIYFWLKSYELTITDKRAYGFAAFGRRVDLPVDSITAIGLGWLKSIKITTASGRISFKLIKNRDEMYETISKLIVERQNKEAKSETVIKQAIPQSNADELKKYKDLLDSGVITQEEFDAKKKQLLGL